MAVQGRRRARWVGLVILTGIAACGSPAPSRTPGASAPVTPGPTAAPVSESAGPTAIPTPAEHRIGVRMVNGDGEFFDRVTGERFVARGTNLIRLDTYHATLSPGRYNAEDVDAQMAAMARLGYNVVRVFHDQRSSGLAGGNGLRLSSAYMDNASDLLSRAKAHGIYVMFTQDWLPDMARYSITNSTGIEGVNALFLASDGVAANARFFGDFAAELVARGAPLDAIWAFELRNELYFEAGQRPFSLTSGQVTAANARTYDMADADQRRGILEDGVVHWIDVVRAEILRHDPTALVAVGFFVPQGPNPTRLGDSRIIETRQAIERSTADFIDLHGYPGLDLPLAKHLENYGLPARAAKPIVMGEMGAFRNLYATVGDAAQALIGWQAASCEFGFDGWLTWTWDSAGGIRDMWNETDANGAVSAALAPANRPDPCSAEGAAPENLALGREVMASAELKTGPAFAAVDGSLGTTWNAGAFPAQWIQIDLGFAVPVGLVRLVVAQSPEGPTRHRLYGGETSRSLGLLHTFEGSTTDGQVLRFTADADDPPLRFLRIETETSPSWVAWREIEVLTPE